MSVSWRQFARFSRWVSQPVSDRVPLRAGSCMITTHPHFVRRCLLQKSRPPAMLCCRECRHDGGAIKGGRLRWPLRVRVLFRGQTNAVGCPFRGSNPPIKATPRFHAGSVRADRDASTSARLSAFYESRTALTGAIAHPHHDPPVQFEAWTRRPGGHLLFMSWRTDWR